MGFLTELGVTGPMPLVFNAPALADQTQQSFWGGADAGEEKMTPGGGADFARSDGVHLDYPAGALRVHLDVLLGLTRPKLPEFVTSVLHLLRLCGERDVALSLEVPLYLAVSSGLI
jgi:hypothetical protein